MNCEQNRSVAKDPEHSEELPWFLKAIDAAYCEKVRALTEAVYQPYYKLFDAKANPAPQRSPVEAATLGATTASKTAAAAAFDMYHRSASVAAETAGDAAAPTTSHSHRTRRANEYLEGSL